MPLDSSPTLRYPLQLPLLLQSLRNMGRDSENDVCLHGRLGSELFYPSFWSTSTNSYHQNLPCLSKWSGFLCFSGAFCKISQWLDPQMVYRNLEKKTLFELLVETTVFWWFALQLILMLSFFIFNYIEYPLIQEVWLSRGSGSRALGQSLT